MGKRNWLPVTGGIAYVLTLLSVATPLSIITINLIMVPMLVLFMHLPVKTFTLTILVATLALWGLAGGVGLGLGMMALFFLPAAVVLGLLYKRKTAAKNAVIITMLTLLGEQLLLLFLSFAAGLNPIGRYRVFLQGVADEVKGIVKQSVDPALIDQAVPILIQMIPLFMITMAVLYVMVTHGLGRWLLGKGGISVPALAPLRQWRLPKSLIVYYILAVGLDFFVDIESDSMLSTVTVNLLPLLTIAFIIQSLSFLYYLVHVKRWNRLLPIGAIVLMIIFFPAVYLFSLLGLLDTGFPIRDRITGTPR